MTLAIACFTANHCIQVSDRRLVWTTGPKAGDTADDNTNKALVVYNRIAISYTGLAEIGAEKTDDWLLEAASKVNPYNPQRVINAIAEGASEVFRKIRLPAPTKRHAFLVSGWAKFVDSKDETNAPLGSFACAISNSLTPAWTWETEAKDNFQIRWIPLKNRPFQICSVGQPIPSKIAKIMVDRIRAYNLIERGPDPYIKIVARAILDTAASNDSVGRNLMAISLPRAALERRGGLVVPLSGKVPTSEPVALYLPENASPITYGPNFTCDGSAFGDIRVGSGPVRPW
jgi:hypothetical protein